MKEKEEYLDEEETIDHRMMVINKKGMILALLVFFVAGMISSCLINFLAPAPAIVVPASGLSTMSMDEVDEYYGGRKLRVVDATVVSVHTDIAIPFIVTNVGSVFFSKEEDCFKVREGDLVTFIGAPSLKNDGNITYHNASFVNVTMNESE